ncbi:hydroxyethylthiazole kinase [Clostridium uliginosum]|uniref:Hydroxyethylthiazole kinase n=1 Tax=Clostridium uliginosum TaxID=119641 RepID=A0A1I1H2U6_9CLOT|nr:hydroxyethylthiazole kinase [Clostridium uliginosum]SFC16438.1 hydroxyethylthiazole kinase [Clostridium uliginosum]
MFEKILENVHSRTPLVHCITNYVTVNDCANIVLASGGSPIMADDINEVDDITSLCNSLVINMGTLNEFTVSSMIAAGKKANQISNPVILDPVGVGASKFRNETMLNLLCDIRFSVIRGNISEIKTVYKGNGITNGVDADKRDYVNESNIGEIIELAKELSKKTGAIIVITGAIDIVADSKKAYIIKNGHPLMAKVTGTGCMLTAVIGSFCGANEENMLEATAAAVCTMGLCGELAFEKLSKTDGGTATYRMYLIDYMSKMTNEMLNEGMKIKMS